MEILADGNNRITLNRFLLEWKDVTYSVKTNHQNAQILKGVAGFAKSGEMLAVMGSSGSGKTSLLSILSNRIINQPGLKIGGEVVLNKVPIRSFSTAQYIKYVVQEDDLFATQSVRECLQFSARLKIPHFSAEQVNERVNGIIADLKLEKVADNLIGNKMTRGLSGGEKKRVSIGNELISYPSVLILDEPTSGLDSIIAENIIYLLQKQARLGKMIIFSIHQPSSRIYKMFDRLILMSEGTFLYQGIASESVEYFTNLGYTCNSYTNPPDYYMRILHVANRHAITDAEQELFKHLSESYNKNSDKCSYYYGNEELMTINKKNKPESTTFSAQFGAIFERNMLYIIRQPWLSSVKIIQVIFMSILIILIYHGNSGNFKSMQNYQGVLFFNVINSIGGTFQAQLLLFPLERPVFIKNYKENLYGVMSYFSAKIISELPFQIAVTSIYCCIIYFVIPFNDSSVSKFFIYFGIILLCQISGNAMGYWIGSYSNNRVFSGTLGTTLMTVLTIFSGFFSNTKSLSSFCYWIQYLSPFNYAYRAFILNQFTDFTVNAGVINPIDELNFQGVVWQDIGSLLLLLLGFYILTLINLKVFGEYSKRKNI